MNTKLLTEEDRKQDLLEFLESSNVSLLLFPYSWICSTDFFTAPASRGFHSSYAGGLYDHSKNVALTLLDLTRKGVTTRWSRVESPLIVGLLHDVTKINRYIGGSGTYIKNPMYSSFGGHGYDSVCKVEQHMELTEEERLCIRYHMGPYETGDWEGYDKAIRKFPNVLWTSAADLLSAKVLED